MRSVIGMMAALYGLGFANIFLRSSMGVLAPELSGELALSPALLGAIASAFFISYALMQIPTGMLLDRFGPRRVVNVLFALTVAGTAMFALADDGALLVISRLAMGVGCAGVFAAAFMIIPRFYSADRLTSIGGALNSFAMVGTLCATAPLAALVVWLGWRTSFLWIAAGMAVVWLLGFVFIRDFPPGERREATGQGESVGAMLRGAWQVLRTPGVLPLASAGFALSAGNTFLSIWGGPYLHDVHGLGEVERGTALVFMALAGVAGHFVMGQIARRLNTLKWIVVVSCCGIIAITSTFAIMPAPSVTTVTVLFACLGLACSFPTILLAHGRALVPERLIGRGITTVNTGVMIAIAMMQLAVGAVIGRALHVLGDQHHILAYRIAFAFIALMAVLSTLCYLQVKDCPPRPDRSR